MPRRPANARQPLAEADTNANIASSLLEKPKAAKATSNKRKASSIDTPQEIPEIDSDDERLNYITDNCNKVRQKIRTFIESGEMKVTQFQREIGVTSSSYTSFMGQNGPDKGSQSNVYWKAFRFFKKRDLQGIKAPRKKVKKDVEEAANDVSMVHLDGESDQEVEVYDTCDEVRKKIAAHLAKPDVTKAGFLREIAKTYPEGKKFGTGSLNDFLSKKGSNAGNTSGVFYAAYVYFEKMRIRDQKPKSKFREEMEDVWNGSRNYPSFKPGFDLKHGMNTGYICMQGTKPYVDKYGQVRISRG